MMTSLKALTATFLFLASTSLTWAKPVELQPLVAADTPRGCTSYTLLIWDLYDAELWSDAAALPGESYALSLTYRTDFTRAELVDSSIDEMARMSDRSDDAFGTARDQLMQAFRNVVPGDRITAWRDGAKRVLFFLNGAEIGALTSDVDLFMDIWLGSNSRDLDGRQALLSGGCNG